MLEVVIFYLSALIAIGGAVLMIAQRNPVASVLYLIVSLAAQAVLYIQLSALFVGALLIIVYAGAILVLFLFVIMLLNLRGEHFEGQDQKVGRITKYVLSGLFFIELVIIVRQLAIPARTDIVSAQTATDFGGVEPVAELLYTKYLFPFELTSVLLLVAVVGAVVMARREKSEKQGGV
ncbi:MAG: NADH-quinone oxidoreductase subunit J [candidate division Zixibacteria bacterium]|nr:NADH-quinone oxidoreductase subunit J [candidate division Zixibacteria bacterium]